MVEVSVVTSCVCVVDASVVLSTFSVVCAVCSCVVVEATSVVGSTSCANTAFPFNNKIPVNNPKELLNFIFSLLFNDVVYFRYHRDRM